MAAAGTVQRIAHNLRLVLLLSLALSGLLGTTLVSPTIADAGARSIIVRRGHATATAQGAAVTEGIGRVAFVVPRLPSGTVAFAVELRRSGSHTYRTGVTISRAGTMRLWLVRAVGGRAKLLTARVLPGRVRAGQTLWVEGWVGGSRRVVLRGRAWIQGTAKPAYQRVYVDSFKQRITSAGKVRASAQLSANAPAQVRVWYGGLVGVSFLVVPTTLITAGPVNGGRQSSTAVAYRFSSTTPDATFQCHLDTHAYRTCRSPVRYSGLRTGRHSVKIRARSYRGALDPSPAYRLVTIFRSTAPNATNTGVPRGTRLRVHVGNITVTRAGTRLDALDIRGFVLVRAANVKITRSIIRGGIARFDQGLVTNYGYPNLLISDSYLRPSHPSVWLDGIKGWNFTARRVHVVGNVDSIKVHGDNVHIDRSLLENTTYFRHDPNQRGGPTHNDNIQVLKGRNVTITGNTIRGATNFAILGSAGIGDTPNLLVSGNWVDGGHCTVKLQSLKAFRLSATVTYNSFGPHRHISYCAFQAEPQVRLSAHHNVLAATGKPVAILRKKY